MKYKSFYFLFFGLIIFSILSCKKRDERNFNQLLMSNNWSISFFKDTNLVTKDYSSVTLKFKDDGSLIVENDSNSSIGSWHAGYFDENSSIGMRLKLELPLPYNDLAINWEVTTWKKSDEIKLDYFGFGGYSGELNLKKAS